MTTIKDPQKSFEFSVCEILGFNNQNSIILQREDTERMILDDFDVRVDEQDVLSGTVAYNPLNKDFLLVATKDSEVNHISEITSKMIDLMVDQFCYTNPRNNVTLATNLPVMIHSSKAKRLEKEFNFKIVKVGYSFCQKHNLEYTEMY